MRSGLLAFGVLLFIIGAALYFLPGAAAADTRAYARPLFSVGALASIGMLTMVLGAILAILGLLVPAAKPDVHKHYGHSHADHDGHVHKRVETRTTRNKRGRRVSHKRVEEYD
jgi:hypothetical protein